jgi:hypothetical protein
MALGLVVLLAVGVLFMASKSTSKVQGIERAAGVHPAFFALLDEWERVGTHRVVIPAKLVRNGGVVVATAGLRTDASEQAALTSGGLSNAATLKSTPHGWGYALDVHPEGFDPTVAWAAQPADVRAKFFTFGTFAEQYTAPDGSRFAWGGRWQSQTFPNGDQPHVELRDWRERARAAATLTS